MKDDTHHRIQRRRGLANSLHIPAELATPFTEGEMAALKIIAEHVRCGACTLARDAIAFLSCTSRTVVKDAIRTAEATGLLKRERIRGRGRRTGPSDGAVGTSPSPRQLEALYDDPGCRV
jgi:hypothetical protein